MNCSIIIIMLAIRREVVDYGAIPLSSWLPHGDSTAAIQNWLRHSSEIARVDGTHRKDATPHDRTLFQDCPD